MIRVLKKSYEEIKEEEIRKSGKVPIKDKFPKREKTKYDTIKAIVENLPSTLQVLHKRTGYSKTTLKLYLEKLMSHYVRAVRRELDMYFLEDQYKSLNPNAPPSLHLIWIDWQNLPEYRTPRVLEGNKKGSAVKLALKGHKPIGDTKTVKRKLREYKKKHGKKPLG